MPAKLRERKSSSGTIGARAASLRENEKKEQDRACGERRHHGELRPAAMRCGDESIDQRAQGTECQQGTLPVQTLRAVEVTTLGNAPQGDPDRGQRDYGVDEKDHPPGGVVHEPAAEQGAAARGDGRGARPDSDRRAALFLIVGGADERQ